MGTYAGKVEPQPVSSLRSGVADALFSSTKQRVLALLFGQPERSFYTTEMIALTGAGSGAVQRELAQLETSGLVVTTRLGNQKHYRANPASPIFSELCSIVGKTLGSGEVIRAALAPLATQIDLSFVYGSMASGKDTSTSDIDLLIVSDTLTLEEIYEALRQVEQQLGRPIHITLLTQGEFRTRHASRQPFLTRLLAGNRLRLFGNERELLGAP